MVHLARDWFSNFRPPGSEAGRLKQHVVQLPFWRWGCTKEHQQKQHRAKLCYEIGARALLRTETCQKTLDALQAFRGKDLVTLSSVGGPFVATAVLNIRWLSWWWLFYTLSLRCTVQTLAFLSMQGMQNVAIGIILNARTSPGSLIHVYFWSAVRCGAWACPSAYKKNMYVYMVTPPMIHMRLIAMLSTQSSACILV